MEVLFFLLSVLSLLLLFAGLVKPSLVIRWGENKTRKNAALVFGSATLIFFALAVISTETSKEQGRGAVFELQSITESSVRTAIESRVDNITEVKIANYANTIDIPDDKVVNVYYLPTVFDEESAMREAALTAIDVMEILFKNQKIGEVVMWQQGEFTDKFGKTEVETAVRILMDKKIADKIANWNNVKDNALLDYRNFFNVAELQLVHAAIKAGLQQPLP